MAVVTTKSAYITNRDATPAQLSNARSANASLKQASGLVAIASGDSVASKYIFFSLPSNAVVSMMRINSPDIGTTTVGDLGLYRTTKDGGAVVDADFFASALSLKDGAMAFTVVLNESGVYPVTNMEKPLWQALGLTADPNVDYDVVLTLTGAADAAGDVLLQTQFTV